MIRSSRTMVVVISKWTGCHSPISHHGGMRLKLRRYVRESYLSGCWQKMVNPIKAVFCHSTPPAAHNPQMFFLQHQRKIIKKISAHISLHSSSPSNAHHHPALQQVGPRWQHAGSGNPSPCHELMKMMALPSLQVPSGYFVSLKNLHRRSTPPTRTTTPTSTVSSQQT